MIGTLFKAGEWRCLVSFVTIKLQENEGGLPTSRNDTQQQIAPSCCFEYSEAVCFLFYSLIHFFLP
jgi:hypothetical protein